MSNVIAPILFLTISIGLFFAYVKPAYNNLQDFQNMETELDTAISDADRLVANYDDLRKKKSSISSGNLTKLNKILPEDIDLVQLIIDIDSLTKAHELTINSFELPQILSEAQRANETRNPQDDSLYNSAILTVEFSGDYANFKEFLFNIEKSISLVDVVKIGIEVQDETYGDEYKKNVYTLGLQAYWQKEN